MTTQRTDHTASRRTALASLGVGGLSLALATRGGTATAQEGGGDLAGHPLVGTWAVMTPGGVVPQIHGADGSVIAAFPPNYVDPALGLTFQGPGLGRWEPDGERTGHFTFFQALSDANGALIGSLQLLDALEASEDGQTWSGSNLARIIMRDAANTVISDQMVPSDTLVTAHRIGAIAESLVLPVVTLAVATPEA